MIIMKKYFLALLFVLFFGLFISQKTYAIEDYSVTYTWGSVPSNDVLCGGNSGRTCSDYSYLIVDSSVSCTNNAYMFLYGFLGDFFGTLPVCSSSVFSLSNAAATIQTSSVQGSGSGSFTITLTDTAPGEPCDCPEPEPTPEPEPCPDPEENSQFINVVIDAFWKYHKVFAGCVAALIAIFVLYRIIKGAFR